MALKEAQQLSAPDPRQRVKAMIHLMEQARGLSSAQQEEALRLLGACVPDQEAFVRWNLAIAVGRLGHPKGLELLRQLAGDEHANVRWRVALSCGLIGSPDGLGILANLANDPYKIGEHFVVRAYVAQALGMIRDPGGVNILSTLVADEDPVVRSVSYTHLTLPTTPYV